MSLFISRDGVGWEGRTVSLVQFSMARDSSTEYVTASTAAAWKLLLFCTKQFLQTVQTLTTVYTVTYKI